MQQLASVVSIQVVLWDTGDMESNSVNSMTKSYFAECVGVIMVYKKGDIQSLMSLDQWWNRAVAQSQFCSCLVFSLWCNDIGGDDSDEVTDDHIQKYVKKWSIPSELMFNINPDHDDEISLQINYKKLVEAVMVKTRHIALQRSGRSQSTIRLPDATTQSGSIQEKPKKKCFASCNN